LPLALLGLAACGEQEPLTAPAGPAGQPEAAVIAAAQRIVNSLADPGTGTCDATECTLREAIKDPASTAISFAPGLTGTITLASPTRDGGSLVIDKKLTITGSTAGIVIRRRTTDPEFRILRIGKAGVVTLKNLTLRGGKAAAPGGGILNFGGLVLDNCRVQDNVSAVHGGGIDNHGPLTLTNSKLTGNIAGYFDGGGIHNHNKVLTIANSSVSYNSGTGVGNGGGTLTITNSVIGYNAGPTGGRGISQGWGTATLDRVKVVGNGPSGGFASGGIAQGNSTMTIRNSTVARNGGVGISNTRAGRLTVVSSTIAGNAGAGITSTVFMRSTVYLTVTNSTISGNAGDGLYAADHAEGGPRTEIVNSTIALNGGHGVVQDAGSYGGTLLLTNSIVALNGAPTAPDVYNRYPDNSFVAGSSNLIGDGTGSGMTNEDGNKVGNVSPYTSPIDPLLGALTNNGGPTATHALLAGSPALDAGTSDGCPTTDQRGVARPQGPACDMGSFER
jgi:CSLREA domain-containing protein